MMRSLLLALQFLSIFPIKIKGDVTEADMLRSAYAFTVTGFLIGVVLVIADFFLARLFSSALVSALVLLVLVLITGALHLDGLADTFDALACRGGREDKLSAMRDPSSGPVGMVAVMFVLGLKFLAIEEVASLSYYLHYVALLFMPVMGRWVQVAGMFLGKPSRPDGLGTIFIGKVGTGIFITTTAIALLLFAGVAALAAEVPFKQAHEDDSNNEHQGETCPAIDIPHARGIGTGHKRDSSEKKKRDGGCRNKNSRAHLAYKYRSKPVRP